MPKSIKDHASHDVLTLCVPCQQDYEPHTTRLKQAMVVKYNVAIEGRPWHYNTEKKKVRSAAMALLKSKAVVPFSRVQELEAVVCAYFKVEIPTEEMLQMAVGFNVLEKGENFEEHGEVVLKSMNSLEEKVDFVRQWRRHFLECMKPKFLSPEWKVQNDVVQN
jgi:hypothetical protein